MKTIMVEKVVIDLKSGQHQELVAEVANKRTDKFHTYSLTYDGYRSDWKVKGE